MIGLAALLLTGSAVAAEFKTASFVTWKDYPKQSIRRKEEGAMLSLVVTSPKGRVERCETVISSDYPLLDEAACKAIKKARVKPARDRSGEAVHGAFKRWNMFSIPGPNSRMKSFPESVDMELHVNRLPVDTPDYLIVVVNLVVDTEKRVESCDIAVSSGHASVDTIACTSGARLPSIIPISNSSGQFSRSVQQFRIGITTNTNDPDQPENSGPESLTPPSPPAAHSSP
jgi:TonB family protein